MNAKAFWNTYFCEHSIQVTESDSSLSLEYTFGELLINQIEQAGIIHVTNADQISEERLAELIAFLQNLQPNAIIKNGNDTNDHCENSLSSLKVTTADDLYRHQIKLFSSSSNLEIIGQYGIDTLVYQRIYLLIFRR
ncbi:hypothetical protein [Bacillus sp. JCM 19034]|uniref:hypothetical protein n=1 Tax=Bacillus sp. JCM 19034 TaxID=1481928 RepID=UPI0007860935|nr:hypothetical protein [Bacillus sp. JCM 19034]